METLGLEHLADRLIKLVDVKRDADDKAKEPKIIKDLSTDTNNAVFVGGELDTDNYPKQKPRRFHTVRTINDFAAAVIRWAKADESSLWVASDAVTLICDDEWRIDRIKMPLHFSEGYKIVSDYQSAKVIDQKNLVALLRTKLAQYMTDDGKLLSLVRRLKWAASDMGHSTIMGGAASLGRSVEKELSGLDGEELPESFEVEVPIWRAPIADFRELIRVDITIDFDSQRFRLEVSADSIEAALLSAQERLRTAIAAALPEGFRANVLLGSV